MTPDNEDFSVLGQRTQLQTTSNKYREQSVFIATALVREHFNCPMFPTVLKGLSVTTVTSYNSPSAPPYPTELLIAKTSFMQRVTDFKPNIVA